MLAMDLTENNGASSQEQLNKSLFVALWHPATSVEEIKTIAAKGACLDAQEKWTLETPLFFAINARRNITLIEALCTPANVNIPSVSYGESGISLPLAKAAYQERLDVVLLLKNKGARPLANICCLIQRDYIHIDRFLTVLKEIITPENINAPNEYGSRPIQYAFYRKKFDIARFLIDHGAQVQANDLPPLRIMGEKQLDFNDPHFVELLTMIKLLKTKGAQSPSDMSDFVNKPVPLEIIKELTTAQNLKTINHLDANGTSLLEKALGGRRLDVAQFLLDNGVQLKSRNNVLKIAIYQDADLVSDFNISSVISPQNINDSSVFIFSSGEASTAQPSSPLMCAVQKNRLQLVAFLVQAGADVNARHPDTALDVAVEIKAGPSIIDLVCTSENSNFVNSEGRTPMLQLFLHTKREQKRTGNYGIVYPRTLYGDINETVFESLKILIQRGADVNAQDEEGYTLLDRAVNQYYEEQDFFKKLIQILRNANALISIKALTFAQQKKDKELLTFLITSIYPNEVRHVIAAYITLQNPMNNSDKQAAFINNSQQLIPLYKKAKNLICAQIIPVIIDERLQWARTYKPTMSQNELRTLIEKNIKQAIKKLPPIPKSTISL